MGIKLILRLLFDRTDGRLSHEQSIAMGTVSTFCPEAVLKKGSGYEDARGLLVGQPAYVAELGLGPVVAVSGTLAVERPKTLVVSH